MEEPGASSVRPARGKGGSRRDRPAESAAATDGPAPVDEPSAAGEERAAAGEPTGTKEPRAQPLCSFGLCPICTALTAVGDARPDLVEHLLLASREMLLALRALIDARLASTEAPSSKLERLTIG